MQIKIFTIPVFDGEVQMTALNKFLSSYKIVTVEQQLVSDSTSSFWTFCVKYIAGGIGQVGSGKTEKVDYKSILSEDVFAVFNQLRVLRKELATADAVPAYAVFTDEELAKISKLESLSAAHLMDIPGIGTKKVEKYGQKLVEMYEKARLPH